MNPSTTLDRYPLYNTYIPQATPTTTGNLRHDEDDRYIATTKIMVLALAVLFAVAFFVICLHIYAKWIWRSHATRAPASFSFSFWPRRRRNRASHGDEIVLDADVMDINMVMGLGKSAVEALPKFRYERDDLKPTAIGEHLECPICLGRFEEGDMGRALPKCGHSFHLECIDMWLYSHSTCPLCRAVLEPDHDEAISLNLEAASIQVFHLEGVRRARGADPDHDVLPQPADLPPPEPLGSEAEQPSQLGQEQDAGKRADSIPANILFWGAPTQQATAEFGLSTVVNNNSPPTPSQVVIDIAVGDDLEPGYGDGPTAPRSATAAAPAMPRNAATVHRFLGRGRLRDAAAAEAVDEMAARPSPSPSRSAAPASSRLRGHGGVFSEEA